MLVSVGVETGYFSPYAGLLWVLVLSGEGPFPYFNLGTEYRHFALTLFQSTHHCNT